jgi:hypothetical protein
MAFRESVCSHCRRAPAADACAGCGLWTCAACAPRCRVGRVAWTGRCRGCGELYPDEQRRDVVDDGDGEICCPRCGWVRRLRRLDRLRDPVAAAALARAGAGAACAECARPAGDLGELLVLHVPADQQTLYHLLCRCGATLASAAG